MRSLVLLVALALGCATPPLPPEDVFAEARFVDDVHGDDSADGTTPETAWKTLARVNAFIPRTSTSIRFKRGGTWRGTEIPFEVDGQRYLARLELHYHPPRYQGGPNGWHKGVTVYRATT